MTFNRGAWADERHVEALEKHWAAGLTCSQISAELARDFGASYSRNAVIGKISRLGLVNPKAKGFKTGPFKRKSKPRQARTRITRVNSNSTVMRATSSPQTDLPTMRCVEVVPRNLTLMELDDTTCRYPYGDQAPFLYCGHFVDGDGSWCLDHLALCTGRGTTAERAAGPRW